MINFLKGIVAGIGGVSPGLSGSVLLILLGLYHQTLEALGTLLRHFKQNIRFLLPILLGMGVGVLLFSKVIDFCLTHYEMPTRFCFLGLILGTIPLFYQEVRKKGFSRRHWLVILGAVLLGAWMFTANPELFPLVTDPNLAQCIFLGVAVVATAIVPGLDPAVVLSTLGYYECYVRSLANFYIPVLAPMVIGVALGGVAISWAMTALFRRFYTATFSVVFGLFLSMVPNMLGENWVLGPNPESVLSVLLMFLGFAVSFYLGDFKAHNARIRAALSKPTPKSKKE